jgi:predicted Fe-Mo cluster-binding NifX family protein
MRVAIPLYGERVAPRLAFAHHIMIVELRAGHERYRDVYTTSHLHPMQIPDFLAGQGVTKLIAGGVNRYLQELCRLQHIDVIWGINGKVDEVLMWYLKNGLRLGMGSCPPPRRKRRRVRGV